MSQCWCWNNIISNLRRFELESEDFWFLGVWILIILFVVEDIQGLGKVESAQELGRECPGIEEARWLGCRPTPDPQRGVPEEWIKQAEPPGDL